MRLPIALLTCLGLLAACNKEPPAPPPIPVESAGEAMKRDNADISRRLEEQKATADKSFNDARAAEDRAKMIDVLSTARESFSRKVDAAFAAKRSTIAPIIKELEVLRTEAEGLPTNNCTLPIKSEMVSGMSSAIEGLNLFVKETGDQSEASKAKMLEGSTKLAGMASSLKACQ